MPQLDTTSFFSQIFFTLIIFSFFYSNIIQWVIPFITQTIRIRKNKIHFNLLATKNTAILFYFFYFFKNFKNKTSFNNFFSKLNIYNKSISNINGDILININNILKFNKLNISYLYTILYLNNKKI